tara:strand:+ start:1777 stop:2136 length:360 start_codon:yes stop_codon:yes gene_type:complete
MAVAHQRRAKTTVLCTLKSARKQGFSSLMILKGTKFQLKVWRYIKTIKKGKIKTYKQVAIGIKNPKSARAVANACAKNPYAPKIPCHRVIRSDGGLGGYSGRGGIKQKLKLLKAEKVAI